MTKCYITVNWRTQYAGSPERAPF